MGAYGGTAYASMSEMQWLDGDINHDGLVNMIDIARLGANWLTSKPGTLNQPPEVIITSPKDGRTCCGCTTIQIEAEAWDVDGSIVKVEFFVDGSAVGVEIGKIGRDVDGSDGWQATWFWAWYPGHYPEGEYILTATATDDGGARAVSPTVGVSVVMFPGPRPRW